MNQEKSLSYYENWIKNSASKTRICYFTGYLASWRGVDGNVNELADMFWIASRKGKVDLAQRKLSPGVYEYWATKRRRP